MENTKWIYASAWVLLTEQVPVRMSDNEALEAIRERLQDAPVGMCLVEGIHAGEAYKSSASLYTDGGGWNGKSSLLGYVLVDGPSGDVVVTECVQTIPKELSNNEAEYYGLLMGLKVAPIGVQVFADSELMVRQVLGEYKVKAPHLMRLCQQARNLLELKAGRISWIRREDNIAGKLLEEQRK